MAATDRRLVVVRHAKSAWPRDVPDERRPLGPRGRRDAPAIGRWLRDHVDDIDTVVSSPAERTRQTWDLASAELRDSPAPRYDRRVYAASADDLLLVVRELPRDAAVAVVVGHNPGLEDLVALLCGEAREMKTSSVAVLGWRGSWSDMSPHRAVLEHHVTPRGR
jgi:phosphohistidine phosphatase